MSRARSAVASSRYLLIALAALAGALGAGCRRADARDPVIFVHGCPPGPPVCVSPTGGACSNKEAGSDLWTPMASYFRARGYPESHLNRFLAAGPPCDSTLTQARELSRLVKDVRARTGAAKVDLVGHSMGALTVRLYLLEASEQVDDFVGIAGANHGSAVASAAVGWQARLGAPAYEGAKEMAPPYACQGQASGGAADVQFMLNGCLTPSGRTVERDETPGAVDYLSIRNSLDEMLIPLEGACLNQRFQNDCSDPRVNVEVAVPAGPGPCGPSGCPGHVAMIWDPGVMQRTYDFMAAGASRGSR
jgi:pimeloyl-ACP methyl ester carboxylesterase